MITTASRESKMISTENESLIIHSVSYGRCGWCVDRDLLLDPIETVSLFYIMLIVVEMDVLSYMVKVFLYFKINVRDGRSIGIREGL